MLESKPRTVRVTMFSSTAWHIIEQSAYGISPSAFDWNRDEAKEWASLVEAGIADSPGSFNAEWLAVLTNMRAARAGIRLISEYQGVVFNADITVHDGVSTCMLRRFRRSADGKQLDAAADEIELAVASTSDVWLLIRRVLPPLPEFRAEPLDSAGEEVIVPASAIPALAALALDEDPGDGSLALDPTLQDFISPRAATSMLYWRLTENSRVYALRYWMLGEHFYTLRAGKEQPVIEKVQPGDLGFHASWYASETSKEDAL